MIFMTPRTRTPNQPTSHSASNINLNQNLILTNHLGNSDRKTSQLALPNAKVLSNSNTEQNQFFFQIKTTPQGDDNQASTSEIKDGESDDSVPFIFEMDDNIAVKVIHSQTKNHFSKMKITPNSESPQIPAIQNLQPQQCKYKTISERQMIDQSREEFKQFEKLSQLKKHINDQLQQREYVSDQIQQSKAQLVQTKQQDIKVRVSIPFSNNYESFQFLKTSRIQSSSQLQSPVSSQMFSNKTKQKNFQSPLVINSSNDSLDKNKIRSPMHQVGQRIRQLNLNFLEQYRKKYDSHYYQEEMADNKLQAQSIYSGFKFDSQANQEDMLQYASDMLMRQNSEHQQLQNDLPRAMNSRQASLKELMVDEHNDLKIRIAKKLQAQTSPRTHLFSSPSSFQKSRQSSPSKTLQRLQYGSPSSKNLQQNLVPLENFVNLHQKQQQVSLKQFKAEDERSPVLSTRSYRGFMFSFKNHHSKASPSSLYPQMINKQNLGQSLLKPKASLQFLGQEKQHLVQKRKSLQNDLELNNLLKDEAGVGQAGVDYQPPQENTPLTLAQNYNQRMPKNPFSQGKQFSISSLDKSPLLKHKHKQPTANCLQTKSVNVIQSSRRNQLHHSTASSSQLAQQNNKVPFMRVQVFSPDLSKNLSLQLKTQPSQNSNSQNPQNQNNTSSQLGGLNQTDHKSKSALQNQITLQANGESGFGQLSKQTGLSSKTNLLGIINVQASYKTIASKQTLKKNKKRKKESLQIQETKPEFLIPQISVRKQTETQENDNQNLELFENDSLVIPNLPNDVEVGELNIQQEVECTDEYQLFSDQDEQQESAQRETTQQQEYGNEGDAGEELQQELIEREESEEKIQIRDSYYLKDHNSTRIGMLNMMLVQKKQNLQQKTKPTQRGKLSSQFSKQFPQGELHQEFFKSGRRKSSVEKLSEKASSCKRKSSSKQLEKDRNIEEIIKKISGLDSQQKQTRDEGLAAHKMKLKKTLKLSQKKESDRKLVQSESTQTTSSNAQESRNKVNQNSTSKSLVLKLSKLSVDLSNQFDPVRVQQVNLDLDQSPYLSRGKKHNSDYQEQLAGLNPLSSGQELRTQIQHAFTPAAKSQQRKTSNQFYANSVDEESDYLENIHSKRMDTEVPQTIPKSARGHNSRTQKKPVVKVDMDLQSNQILLVHGVPTKKKKSKPIDRSILKRSLSQSAKSLLTKANQLREDQQSFSPKPEKKRHVTTLWKVIDLKM